MTVFSRSGVVGIFSLHGNLASRLVYHTINKIFRAKHVVCKQTMLVSDFLWPILCSFILDIVNLVIRL